MGTGSPLLGAPFAERAPNVLRRDCHVSDVHAPSHTLSLPQTPFSQQVSSTPYNPLALHTSFTSINPMEWSPTNPFLSPEILSGEPTSISSSLFGSVSCSIDAITRPPLVAMATHEYSAAAAPAEFERAPIAHRHDDRFDSASRFDSSQTPPPFNFQPSFPAEPHSDVSAQVLQFKAEIRQLQLELRTLEHRSLTPVFVRRLARHQPCPCRLS